MIEIVLNTLDNPEFIKGDISNVSKQLNKIKGTSIHKSICWDALSYITPLEIIINNNSDEWLWNFKCITNRQDFNNNFIMKKLYFIDNNINKNWDWNILSLKIDPEYILDNQDKYKWVFHWTYITYKISLHYIIKYQEGKYKWDYNTMIERDDVDTNFLRNNINIINNNINKIKNWNILSNKIPLEYLNEYQGRKYKWNYEIISNRNEFDESFCKNNIKLIEKNIKKSWNWNKIFEFTNYFGNEELIECDICFNIKRKIHFYDIKCCFNNNMCKKCYKKKKCKKCPFCNQ
jgi:hypothetical protein